MSCLGVSLKINIGLFHENISKVYGCFEVMVTDVSIFSRGA